MNTQEVAFQLRMARRSVQDAITAIERAERAADRDRETTEALRLAKLDSHALADRLTITRRNLGNRVLTGAAR